MAGGPDGASRDARGTRTTGGSGSERGAPPERSAGRGSRPAPRNSSRPCARGARASRARLRRPLWRPHQIRRTGTATVASSRAPRPAVRELGRRGFGAVAALPRALAAAIGEGSAPSVREIAIDTGAVAHLRRGGPVLLGVTAPALEAQAHAAPQRLLDADGQPGGPVPLRRPVARAVVVGTV